MENQFSYHINGEVPYDMLAVQPYSALDGQV